MKELWQPPCSSTWRFSLHTPPEGHPGSGEVRQVALAAIREVAAKLHDTFLELVLALRTDNCSACPDLYDFREDLTC